MHMRIRADAIKKNVLRDGLITEDRNLISLWLCEIALDCAARDIATMLPLIINRT